MLINKKVLDWLSCIKNIFWVSLQTFFRSSHQMCSMKKVVLKNNSRCSRFSFLIKLQAAPATLVKNRLWHRCFPVNFAKVLRTLVLQNTSGRLLLFLSRSHPTSCFWFRRKGRQKLTLNHLIGNNCPEFHNGLLDSYFFKLTLGSDCFKLCFWTVAFKTFLTQ